MSKVKNPKPQAEKAQESQSTRERIDVPVKPGYRQVNTGRIVVFDKLGDNINGIITGWIRRKNKNSGDVLTFQNAAGELGQCFASSDIYRSLTSLKILTLVDEDRGMYELGPNASALEVSLTLAEVIPMKGGHRFKSFDTQVREVTETKKGKK